MLRPDTPSCSVSRNTMFKIKKSCKHTHGSKSGQKPISSVRPEAYYQDFLKLYYNFFLFRQEIVDSARDVNSHILIQKEI